MRAFRILIAGAVRPLVQLRSPDAVAKALAEQGWQRAEEPFETTCPKGEDWGWVLYKHPVKKGVVDLADPGGMRILVFK